MGAEQSGDAEHKHAELNSSGECDIFLSLYIFHSITVESQISTVTFHICACIQTYFPLTRLFTRVRMNVSFCRV